jgi:pimeloyl-ACP methyl ester carboxylesterase
MKRAVLALHASLAHGGAFAALTAQLPALHITAPDMIGHGRAAPWDGHSDFHTACTRAAIAQAEALARSQGGPIDLIGHSFGATVALRAALERPELIRTMVLIEPVLFAAARADGAPEYRSYAADHALFQALMADDQDAAAAAVFLNHWGDGRGFDGLPAATNAYVLHRLPLILAQSGGVLGDSGGIMGYLRLQSCPVPALLLRGAASPPIISSIHRALAARLPNMREAVISGAGHMLPLSHPADCARAIMGFLDEL